MVAHPAGRLGADPLGQRLGFRRAQPLGAPRRPLVERAAGRDVLGVDVDDVGPEVRVGREPAGEGRMHHHLGAHLLGQLARTPEVVGMAVGGDDGMNIGQLQVGVGQSLPEHRPRRFAWQAWVNKGHPSIVEQGIAVHMAKAGHLDGQLHAQHAGTDLFHLGVGRQLLLLGRARARIGRLGHGARVLDRPVK